MTNSTPRPGEKVVGGYRKKAVEVEAVQWTGENIEEIRAFLRPEEFTQNSGNGSLWLRLRREGLGMVFKGRFIVRHGDGKLERFAPEIFEATYEPVDQEVEERGGQRVVEAALTELADDFHRRENDAMEEASSLRADHRSDEDARGRQGANASARQLVLDKLRAASDQDGGEEQAEVRFDGRLVTIDLPDGGGIAEVAGYVVKNDKGFGVVAREQYDFTAADLLDGGEEQVGAGLLSDEGFAGAWREKNGLEPGARVDMSTPGARAFVLDFGQQVEAASAAVELKRPPPQRLHPLEGVAGQLEAIGCALPRPADGHDEVVEAVCAAYLDSAEKVRSAAAALLSTQQAVAKGAIPEDGAMRRKKLREQLARDKDVSGGDRG
jgi:hypothetical protein